jgi:protein-L-isoaspartate(D-aspartate) O-methyltransferase
MIRLILASLLMVAASIGGLASAQLSESAESAEARRQMVKEQIAGRGISDPGVLSAMASVPRQRFVPRGLASRAYDDNPLPIGEGQTISQPYIVALMTESLKLSGSENVLEIGTGSGYQAAILSLLARQVVSIEIRESLYREASARLSQLGAANVKTLNADGYFGYKEQAPFDAIMITAAVDHIPPPLLEQLKNGGRLILPLGNPFAYQNLVLVTKKESDYTVQQITGVLFVPMAGAALKGPGAR